jgi:hypothetical protein
MRFGIIHQPTSAPHEVIERAIESGEPVEIRVIRMAQNEHDRWDYEIEVPDPPEALEQRFSQFSNEELMGFNAALGLAIRHDNHKVARARAFQKGHAEKLMTELGREWETRTVLDDE